MDTDEKIDWLKKEVEFCENRIKETKSYILRKELAQKELDILTAE